MIQTARVGGDPRLQLELALFKAARPEDDAAPEALVARIEALEQRAQPVDAVARAPVAVVEPIAEPIAEPEPAAEPEFDPLAEADAEPEVFTDEPASADVAAAAPPSLEEVLVSWPTAVATLNEESPRLGAALENARPERIEQHRLTIGFPESAGFLRKSAEQPNSRDTIAKHIENATGFLFSLDTELLPDAGFAHIVAAANAEPGAGIDQDELVERLKKEFDATELAEVPPE